MRFAKEIAAASLVLAACAPPKPAESAWPESQPQRPIFTMTDTAELPAGFTDCPRRTYPDTPVGDILEIKSPPKWDCPGGTTVEEKVVDFTEGRDPRLNFLDTASGTYLSVPQAEPQRVEIYVIGGREIAVAYGPSHLRTPDNVQPLGRQVASVGVLL